MLARIRSEQPQARRVRTGNAFSNAPMLAINDALGFKAIHTSNEWQAHAAAVRHALEPGADRPSRTSTTPALVREGDATISEVPVQDAP